METSREPWNALGHYLISLAIAMWVYAVQLRILGTFTYDSGRYGVYVMAAAIALVGVAILKRTPTHVSFDPYTHGWHYLTFLLVFHCATSTPFSRLPVLKIWCTSNMSFVGMLLGLCVATPISIIVKSRLRVMSVSRMHAIAMLSMLVSILCLGISSYGSRELLDSSLTKPYVFSCSAKANRVTSSQTCESFRTEMLSSEIDHRSQVVDLGGRHTEFWTDCDFRGDACEARYWVRLQRGGYIHHKLLIDDTVGLVRFPRFYVVSEALGVALSIGLIFGRRRSHLSTWLAVVIAMTVVAPTVAMLGRRLFSGINWS
jgi:hypothetical protein